MGCYYFAIRDKWRLSHPVTKVTNIASPFLLLRCFVVPRSIGRTAHKSRPRIDCYWRAFLAAPGCECAESVGRLMDAGQWNLDLSPANFTKALERREVRRLDGGQLLRHPDTDSPTTPAQRGRIRREEKQEPCQFLTIYCD
jgi:hypothetical protein